MQVGIRQLLKLTANKVITTNTVLATLGIPVPIAANQKQHLRWWIPFTEAAGTAGIKLQAVVPAAGVAFLLSFFIYNLVATHVAIDNAGLQTASASFTGTGANAGNYLAVIELDITNGVNAGNVDLQIAQAVSDAGALTALAGAQVETIIFS